MTKQRLSLCMLTRNDEKQLKDCFQEFRQHVDQIIIADMGSSDHTIETAKQLGADVYQIEWNNNISDVKNFCLDQVKGRWILFLQPNERISAEQWKELKLLLDNPNAEGYLLYIDQSSGNFRITSPVQSLRLFRNRKEYRYQYQLFESIPDEFITNIKDCPIRIRQLADPSVQNEIHSLDLLQEELNKYKENCYLQYLYGVELLNQNRYADSIRYFQLARSKVNLDYLYAPHLYKCFSWSCISLGRDADAFDVLNEGVKYFPYYTDLLVLRADLLNRHQQYEEAIRDLENSLRIRAHPSFKELGTEIDPPVIFENLGELYEKLLDDRKAIACYQQALTFNQENQKLRMTLMDILYRQHEYSEVLEHLEYLEPCLGKEQTDSIRFTCYLMQGESAKAELCFASINKGTLLYGHLLLQRIEDDWCHDRWQESRKKLAEMDQIESIDAHVKAFYHMIHQVLAEKELCPVPFEQQDDDIVNMLQEKLLWFHQVDKAKLLLPILLNGEKEDPSLTGELEYVLWSRDFADKLEKWIEKIRQKKTQDKKAECAMYQTTGKPEKALLEFYHRFTLTQNPMKNETPKLEKEELSCSVIHCEIGTIYEKSDKKKEAFCAYLRSLQWDPLNDVAENKIYDMFQENSGRYHAVLDNKKWKMEGCWFQNRDEFIHYIHELLDLKKKDCQQLVESFSEITESDDSPVTLAYAASCKSCILTKLSEANRKYPYSEIIKLEKQRLNHLTLKRLE